MVEWFLNLSPVSQALLATCFTWFVTALGAAAVFFFKTINRKALDGMLGFAAGVMIAASFWSLLAPTIVLSDGLGNYKWLPVLIGFLLGGAFLLGIDKILPHLNIAFPDEEAEDVKSNWHRSSLLVLAISLHNFPEGMAVSVPLRAAAS